MTNRRSGGAGQVVERSPALPDTLLQSRDLTAESFNHHLVVEGLGDEVIDAKGEGVVSILGNDLRADGIHQVWCKYRGY